jgi:hypothetical protein
MIHFREAAVLRTGDGLFNGTYPVIDISAGVREAVHAQLAAGNLLDQMVATHRTAPWDDPWGKGFKKPEACSATRNARGRRMIDSPSSRWRPVPTARIRLKGRLERAPGGLAGGDAPGLDDDRQQRAQHATRLATDHHLIERPQQLVAVVRPAGDGLQRTERGLHLRPHLPRGVAGTR